MVYTRNPSANFAILPPIQSEAFQLDTCIFELWAYGAKSRIVIGHFLKGSSPSYSRGSHAGGERVS